MKASRLEVLQGASRNGEMSLRNTEKIFHKLEKFNRVRTRNIFRFRCTICTDICTPSYAKTIISEQQNLLREFDWRRAIIEDEKQAFHWLNRRKKTIKFRNGPRSNKVISVQQKADEKRR